MATDPGPRRLPAPLLLLGIGVAALVIGVGSLISEDARYLSPLYWPDLISQVASLYSLGGITPLSASPRPFPLQVARFLGSIFSIIALGAGLRALLGEHFAILRASLMRRHTVVCGLGAKGYELSKSLEQSPRRRGVAAIEVASNPESMRKARLHKVAVITGDATERAILKRANVARAASFVSITGSDSVNIEMAVAVKRLLDSARSRAHGHIQCAVHVGDRRLRDLLQNSSLARGGGQLLVRFFSVHNLTARQFFEENHPEGTLRRPSRVHLVLFGFGPVAESLALQLAAIGHFAGQPPVAITVLNDGEAELEMEFLARYPEFREICALTFRRYDPGDAASRRLDFLSDRGAEGEARQIVVARGSDHRSLAGALEIQALRPRLDSPIHVHIGETEGLTSLMAESDRAATGLIPFGSFAKVCTRELVLGESLDRLARKIHEDYRTKQAARGAVDETQPAMAPWAALSEEYREANRRQADHLPVKLRAAGCRLVAATADRGSPPVVFTEEEIDTLARMEHARWCADRRLCGFRYHEKTDRTARRHAMLVPWESLSGPEQEKDRDAVRNIPALASLIGCRVQRDL